MSRRYALLVGAVIALLICSKASAQALANPFLDDSKVQVIHLIMDPADWTDLQEHYLEDIYYHATFTWNGITLDLGVRSRGGASRSPIKPNLNLNFAHYDKTQTFLGLPFVAIKANNQDPSNLREWISMKLFRKMGIPAPREAPAQVFMNGQLLGFYYIVEHVDEAFLTRNFGENGGFLYEWQANGDNYDFDDLGPDPSRYATYLELKTGQTAPDLQTFADLVQLINRPSSPSFTDADFIQALNKYLDPIQFLTYGATGQVVADADGMIGGLEGLNNFYLYQFHGTSHYYFIPWDKDITFSLPHRDIMDGILNGPTINQLARRLVSIPEYKQVYLNALVKAASLMGGTNGWADSEISREYALIHDAAANDPNKQCPFTGSCGVAEFEFNVDWLHTVLAVRSEFVQSSAMAAGYQPSTNGPQITSVTTAGGGGQLSPGALVNLDGSNLASQAEAYAVPLPRILQNLNTFVAAEGVRVPLIRTSDTNVEFQLPLDIPPGRASIVVSHNGLTSSTADVTVQASTPSFITVVHADGSLVSLSHPPVGGETLLVFATGLGGVNANLPIGGVAPIDPLATTMATPQLSLGKVATNVVFSGLLPGYIALYQINSVVPGNLPSDIHYTDCTLTIDGQSATWQYPSN